MDTEQVCRAFTDLLPPNLRLLRRRIADTVSILVLDGVDQELGVAQFTAGPPEYVGLTLSNGSQYWQNEWAEKLQIEYAQDYARFLIEHIESGRTRTKFVDAGEDVYPTTQIRPWEFVDMFEARSYKE